MSELEAKIDGYASPEEAFRYKAAWHQAGHAVAYHARGLPVLRVVLGAPPAGRHVEPSDDMSRHGAGQIYTEERTPPKFDLAVVAMAGPVAEGKAVYLRCQESWDAVGLGEFHCVEMAWSTTDATSDMEDAARLGRRGELAMAEAEAASLLEYEWAWVTSVAETLLARDDGVMTGDEVEALRPSTDAPCDRQ